VNGRFKTSTNALVSNYIYTTGATSRAGIALPSGVPAFTPGFYWGSCCSIFSFMCMFCRSLLVLWYFFLWPLCCLFFVDIRILITPFSIFKLFLVKCVSSIQYVQNIRGHYILNACILSQIHISRYNKSPHFRVEFEIGVAITEHNQIILSFKNNTYS
jgi:hypothetical protein